jgi:hypothetical protein
MSKFCSICGTEFVDGKCPQTHTVKPMCLNCVSVAEDGEVYRCSNEAVLGIARDKMLAALPDGYEVGEIEVKPMLLKNPCKKCGNYCLDKVSLARLLLEEAGLDVIVVDNE